MKARFPGASPKVGLIPALNRSAGPKQRLEKYNKEYSPVRRASEGKSGKQENTYCYKTAGAMVAWTLQLAS